ncbi:hypothetical protein PHLCEN_2v11292 [Hermanssonia centrifuga]|uniref:Uncharacterized protein n=1 Tax=Hermanssonia centrifuga TaxID=98765 RepID=A0A2R6NKF7_9APHY|nr:hypothetical protein PHLCEN_2v11292 [Hermanssonia centrifuga]
MFKANSPPPPPAKPAAGKKAVLPAYSHYLQSKVVRALERIEAENKMAEAEPPSSPPPSESTTPPDGGKSS